MSLEYEQISVERIGPAGIIRLNRPTKHNALSMRLITEVSAALTALEGEREVRGIVLAGSDRAFSTGGDLNEALTFDTSAKFLPYGRFFREATEKMERCSKPVVAAISGHCVTGGLEIALAADIRIAAENANFSITSAKIGGVAGAGGTQRLPRIVGRSIAMELLFTARFFDAQYAKEIGLVNRVVPNGTVVEAACELVNEISRCAPLSVSWMKTAVQSGMNTDLQSGLDLEAALSANAFGSKDKAEGMSAFLEKRSAVFVGE